MGLKQELFEHSFHPMFTDFPIALWMTSLLWDAIFILTNDPMWSQFAFWTLALGVISAIMAIASGFAEYAKIAPGHVAMRGTNAHMGIMIFTTILFIADLMVRKRPEPLVGLRAWIAPLISLSGCAAILAGGWLGGDLVYRHGLGTRFFTKE